VAYTRPATRYASLVWAETEDSARARGGLELVTFPREWLLRLRGTVFAEERDTSVAIGEDKLNAIRTTNAEVLCALDNSCLTHSGPRVARARGDYESCTSRRFSPQKKLTRVSRVFDTTLHSRRSRERSWVTLTAEKSGPRDVDDSR